MTTEKTYTRADLDAAVAAEREACAKVADPAASGFGAVPYREARQRIANAIRARGDKPATPVAPEDHGIAGVNPVAHADSPTVYGPTDFARSPWIEELKASIAKMTSASADVERLTRERDEARAALLEQMKQYDEVNTNRVEVTKALDEARAVVERLKADVSAWSAACADSSRMLSQSTDYVVKLRGELNAALSEVARLGACERLVRERDEARADADKARSESAGVIDDLEAQRDGLKVALEQAKACASWDGLYVIVDEALAKFGGEPEPGGCDRPGHVCGKCEDPPDALHGPGGEP